METKLIPPKVCCTLMLPNELDKREEIIFFTRKKMSIACLPSIQTGTNHLHVMYIIYFCTILFQVLLVCDHSKRFYINSNTIALQKVTYLRAKSFRFIKIYMYPYASSSLLRFFPQRFWKATEWTNSSQDNAENRIVINIIEILLLFFLKNCCCAESINKYNLGQEYYLSFEHHTSSRWIRDFPQVE